MYVDAYFRSRSSMYEWTCKWILILTAWQAPKGLHSLTTVDTVFGHVPRIGRSEDRQDRATVTGLQESCRWGWLPMKGQLNAVKSMGDDVFMPIVSPSNISWHMSIYSSSWPFNLCRWLWWVVCRWFRRRTWRLPIGLWWCPSLSREDSFMFSLVI